MTVFGPSLQLLCTAGADAASRFVVASPGWFDLQARIQSLLALPEDYEAFQQRYGSPSSGPRMKECFVAMNRLRDVAGRYGDPRRMQRALQQSPALLTNATRPANDIHAAALWTLERVRQDAVALASALSMVPAAGRGTAAPNRVARIKSRFLDAGQIADRMQQTVIHLNTLINQFQLLFDELENAQAIMRIYTDTKSATQRALSQDNGPWHQALLELERERAAAYARWLALTISGCQMPATIGIIGTATMVTLAAPTAGGRFAVGAAAAGGIAVAALGTSAGLAHSAYDDLIAHIVTQPEAVRMQVAYRHDLGALDATMKASLPALTDVIGQLAVVRDAWADAVREIKYRVGELNVENLSGQIWLKDAEIAASAVSCGRIDGAARAFLSASCVDLATVRFGATLPADDPNWRQALLRKLAA